MRASSAPQVVDGERRCREHRPVAAGSPTLSPRTRSTRHPRSPRPVSEACGARPPLDRPCRTHGGHRAARAAPEGRYSAVGHLDAARIDERAPRARAPRRSVHVGDHRDTPSRHRPSSLGALERRRARACTARASPAPPRRPPTARRRRNARSRALPPPRAISFCSRAISGPASPGAFCRSGRTTAVNTRRSSSESSLT